MPTFKATFVVFLPYTTQFQPTSIVSSAGLSSIRNLKIPYLLCLRKRKKLVYIGIWLLLSAKHSLPSHSMRPLCLNPSICSSRFPFFSFSIPIFHKFENNPTIYNKSQKGPPFFSIRCCGSGSVTAKPSWELRRNRAAVQEPDEKVVALRQLFTKPGIGIDAYIIPSQDAHQVQFFFFSIYFLVAQKDIIFGCLGEKIQVKCYLRIKMIN